MHKCLEECNKKGATTIAFPALGAGILHYPSKVVARIMISTVQNYYQTNSTTCIKEIKFVLLDDDHHKEFESFLLQNPSVTFTSQNSPIASSLQKVQSSPSISSSHYPPSIPTPQVVHGSPSTYSLNSLVSPQSIGRFSSYSLSPTYACRIGDIIEIQIVCGDITVDTSDVIVNTTQSDLQLATGTVSKAISQKAGLSMQQSCSMYITQHRRLEEGKVCITQAAGQLRCKMVFHIVAPNNKKASTLSQTVIACLKEAESLKFNSIAFPAIGTGGLSYKPTVAAQKMFEAIIEFVQTHPVHLKQVRIVVFEKDMHQVFVQKCIEFSTKQTVPSKPSFLTQCFSPMPLNSTANKYSRKIPKVNPVIFVPQAPPVQIKVYGKSPEVVQQAEETLLNIIHTQFEGISIDESYISDLEPEQISQIKEKALKLNLTIEIKMEISQIKVRGRKDNVQQLKDVIIKMIHEIEKAVMKIEASKKEAQLKKDIDETKSFLQTKVKWQFLSYNSHYENFSADINYQIEQAYQSKKTPTFMYTNSSMEWCTVYFNRSPMQEENSVTREVINIQRIDIEKG